MSQKEVFNKCFLDDFMDTSLHQPTLSKNYFQIFINVYLAGCVNSVIVFVYCYSVYSFILLFSFSLLVVFKCKIVKGSFIHKHNFIVEVYIWSPSILINIYFPGWFLRMNIFINSPLYFPN